MKETNLATNFSNIFLRYNPQVIVNNAVGGWPDRMLQHLSTAVFVELKMVVDINKDGSFYTGLRQDQAAWLAKWQRKGGKCFMFIGIKPEKELHYGILTALRWSNWLTIPKTKYSIPRLDLVTKSSYDLLHWFKAYLDK